MRLLSAFAILCILGTAAAAQMPQAPPGTICVTPTFWCWALVPGNPGSPCDCPTPNGLVAGYLY